VLSDCGNLISALTSAASDLLRQKTGLAINLCSCLLLFYEAADGSKNWIIDPSFEESCNLSNNLILVTKGGDKFTLQVGADLKTSF
jgi:hypothetical protein